MSYCHKSILDYIKHVKVYCKTHETDILYETCHIVIDIYYIKHVNVIKVNYETS